MIIGIGTFKPFRKMVVVVLLRFLLAERLHNALLSPISFSHRLQPFLYYFHNSLEIKSFFPLNLFQKCFTANYTCCVCRKTFCKQLQFGIVYKPSITEKYNIFLKSGNILRNIFKKAVELYQLKYFSYNHPFSPAYNTDPGRYDNRDRSLQATPKNGGCGSSGFPACGNKPVSCCKLPNNHSCDHLHVLESEILLLKT